MELDPNIDIRPFIAVDEEIKYPFLDHIFPWQIVPQGWRSLVITATTLSFTEQDTRLERVKIYNGVLKISFIPVAHESRNQVLSWIAKGIALDSMKLCMLCGEKGQRRKAEEHSPTLCHKHYVQYVNFLGNQTDLL